MPKTGDCRDPKQTIRLLDDLEKIGFSDSAFNRLHHYRETGTVTTINAHRRYCEGLTHDFVEGSNNELVQRRLEIGWNAYKGGGFNSSQSAVFVALAEAAYSDTR
jgi:hypothetical protein